MYIGRSIFGDTCRSLKETQTSDDLLVDFEDPAPKPFLLTLSRILDFDPIAFVRIV